MFGQHDDVLAAIAQGRHGDVHDVEPVQEIEPEPPGVHLAAQIAIGGGDNPDVDAPRHVLADAAQLAFLDDAQHLRLRPRRQLANLVEKERAAVRFFEHAGALGRRAGERAARVAEQLGLDEVVRQRGTVQRAERRDRRRGPPR